VEAKKEVYLKLVGSKGEEEKKTNREGYKEGKRRN